MENNVNNELLIIIIGSGLAGLTAAISLNENKHKIIIIEKNNFIGGNSLYASSGINASNTDLQKKHNINDSNDLFINDTIKSSQIYSTYTHDLIHTLVNNSNDAIKWLNKYNVEFNELTQLGGHSIKRTHRNSQHSHIGMYIINTLYEYILTQSNIKILLNSYVNNIIFNNGEIIGIEYNDKNTIYGDAVILASGGYSSNKKLLDKINKKLKKIPTTNGKWAMGDGIYLANNISAQTLDINSIQIHPTGFINPNDIKNPTKILAAEILRGSGGILCDYNGDRFCNELGTRQYISDIMLQYNNKIFYIIIPEKIINIINKIINNYVDKELLILEHIDAIQKKYKLKNLTNTLNEYNKKIDKFGKTEFPNIPFELNMFYVGKVTPCIHYSHGGIQINQFTNVIDKSGFKLSRLYAIGETTGGLHGLNRLGGNSLLETVVYGIISSNEICKLTKRKQTNNDIYFNNNNTHTLKKYKMSEIKNTKLTVIYNNVYDLSNFEHPGLKESIISSYGNDSTKLFESVHDKKLLLQLNHVGILT